MFYEPSLSRLKNLNISNNGYITLIFKEIDYNEIYDTNLKNNPAFLTPSTIYQTIYGKYLAKKTDEGLAIMKELHTGEVVNFDGEMYQVKDARLLPRPVQRPRVPVWVAAMLPAKPGQRRAARWDGIMPHVMPANLDETQDISDLDMRPLFSPSPEQIREVIEFTSALRDTDDPFEVVVSGVSYGLDKDAVRSKLQSYQEAGTTWWLEWPECGKPGTLAQVREQIQAGPPGA